MPYRFCSNINVDGKLSGMKKHEWPVHSIDMILQLASYMYSVAGILLVIGRILCQESMEVKIRYMIKSQNRIR